MSDVHTLSGPYALDAVDHPERAGFERHLAKCDSCRSEAAGLREAMAHLAEISATPPPAELGVRIISGATSVRPLPPRSVEVWTRRWRAPAIAAAVRGSRRVSRPQRPDGPRRPD